MAATRPEAIVLGFKDLHVCSMRPCNAVLEDVSGFVPKNGLTAVLGASSSGKSMLMKAVSGRLAGIPGVAVSGLVTLDGCVIDCNSDRNHVSYVPQTDDSLIGVLSARQLLTYAARLKTNLKGRALEEHVSDTIRRLGLERDANTLIGTIYKRGLSGGQKRRVTVGVDLVANPTCLLLDEPTSGLDTSTAVSVISSIRDLAKSSSTGLGIMMSIHQPSLDILQLIDHFLLLSSGRSVFFGTLAEARTYFDQLGFQVPVEGTPTDHYLMLTDTTFPASARASTTDFPAAFRQSLLGTGLRHTVKQSGTIKETMLDDPRAVSSHRMYASSSWRQYTSLVRRNFQVGMRDLSLFWMQMVLHSTYGFLIGALFYQLPYLTGGRLNDLPGSIIWVLGANVYIQVFKVHYLVEVYKLYQQERQNLAHGVLSFFLAELTTILFWGWIFIPGVLIAFFMMGYPTESLGFVVLVTYVAYVAAESLAAMVVLFTSPNSALGVMLTQGIMIVMFVFAGGVFIDDVPNYWSWLMELSIFVHAARAMMVDVFSNVEYICASAVVNQQCDDTQFSGNFLPCSRIVNGECFVDGRIVLETTRNVTQDKWESLGYLIALAATFRLINLILLRWSWRKVMRSVGHVLSSGSYASIRRLMIETASTRLELNVLSQWVVKDTTQGRAARVIQRTWRGFALRLAFRRVVRAVMARGPERHGQQITDTRLVFQDMGVTLPNGRVLIDQASAVARGGAITALMGPSGAGKTVLLDALSGRVTFAKVAGEVWFQNGEGQVVPFSKDLLDFVPQFDYLNTVCTVLEVLMHAARLKSPEPERVLRKRVFELLAIVGMKSQADTLCSQLTGGEAKRVSIAKGLVSQPSCLFLDEIVRYISTIARTKKIVVVMTIHQPSSSVFHMMDEVLLLAAGGKMAFTGPVPKAVGFFASNQLVPPRGANPADFFLVAISDRETDWKSKFDSSSFRQPIPSLPQSMSQSIVARPSEAARFWELYKDFLRYYWREPGAYMYRIYTLGLLAFFLGTLFLQINKETQNVGDISGGIFYSIWCILFVVVSGTGIQVFSRLSLKQEYSNGMYSLLTWTVAQFLASLPYVLAGALLFQIIFHWSFGVNMSFESFIYAVLLAFQLQLLMEGLVWIVVEVFTNAMLSTTFSMIILGTLFLFPGFFIKESDMPVGVQWVSYIMPTRYALQGLLFAYLDGVSLDSGDGQTIDGGEVLTNENFFDLDKEPSKWLQFLIMWGWILAIRAGHFLGLYLSSRKLGQMQTASPKKTAASVQPADDPTNVTQSGPRILMVSEPMPVPNDEAEAIPMKNVDESGIHGVQISAL